MRYVTSLLIVCLMVCGTLGANPSMAEARGGKDLFQDPLKEPNEMNQALSGGLPLNGDHTGNGSLKVQPGGRNPAGVRSTNLPHGIENDSNRVELNLFR